MNEMRIADRISKSFKAGEDWEVSSQARIADDLCLRPDSADAKIGIGQNEALDESDYREKKTWTAASEILRIAKDILADDYDQGFGQAITRLSPMINGWKANWEYPGFVQWSNSRDGNTIEATPFWEGHHGVPVQITTEDGMNIEGLDIPMSNTGDALADAETYVGLMRRNWSRIERLLPKKAKELSVPEKHQKAIALKTLKMNDAMANVMGGMNKEEAREFLKGIGYSDSQIKKLEE